MTRIVAILAILAAVVGLILLVWVAWATATAVNFAFALGLFLGLGTAFPCVILIRAANLTDVYRPPVDNGKNQVDAPFVVRPRPVVYLLNADGEVVDDQTPYLLKD